MGASLLVAALISAVVGKDQAIIPFALWLMLRRAMAILSGPVGGIVAQSSWPPNAWGTVQRGFF